MNRNLSSFLNISRWLAACLVLTGHARHLILVDLAEVEHKTLICKGLYFVTGLGHEAVVIFFVISGLLVGGLTLDRWRAKSPDLRAYASARASRIYTVLIPALLSGITLDLIGLHWFNASQLYTNPTIYHTISLNHKIDAAMNLPTFLGNLFMMQGILTGNLGSNGPLWSLAYEWWYYCIFALIGAALTGAGNKRISYAIAAIAFAIILPGKLMLWGTIWALGICAHTWIKSKVWHPHPALGIGLFLVAIIASRLSHNVDNVAHHESLLAEFVRDFVLGISYVAALASAGRIAIRIPLIRFHERLADFSYTTYLCHFPAMLFIVAVGYQDLGFRFRLQPGVHGLVYLLGLTLALYSYCFALSELSEQHTTDVRKKLDAYLGRDWHELLPRK